MIAEEKRQLILDEGVPVEVHDHTGALLYTTKALVGKATRQSMSEISHEAHRKAHFIPELDIRNGLIVTNLVTLDKYITLANMVEAYGNEVVTVISRMTETNAVITVTGLVETADENGDIFKGDVVKVADLPAFVEVITGELRQFQPGLHPNSEYVIYCSAMDFEALDKVVITKGSREIKVKVDYVDYLTYEGAVLLQVCSETRA